MDSGRVDLSLTGVANIGCVSASSDQSFHLFVGSSHFVSRLPIPIVSFGNIVRPFSPMVWAMTGVTTFALATFFLFASRVYQSSNRDNLRSRGLDEPVENFYLYSFFRLTEPDPLCWFTSKWSAGRLGVLLWSLLSLFLMHSYSSNLRAHIMAVQYERPLKTLEDIISNGRTVYIYKSAFGIRHKLLFFEMFAL